MTHKHTHILGFYSGIDMKLIHQWEGGLHKHDTQTHKHTHILGVYSGIDVIWFEGL